MLRKRAPGPPFEAFELNRASQQAVGLVAWWPTMFASGTVLRDYTTLGNTGTLTQVGTDAAYMPSLQASQLGRAVLFNGAASGPKNGFIGLAKTITTVPFSVCFWFNLTSAASSSLLFWTGKLGDTTWYGHYIAAQTTLNVATVNSNSFTGSSGGVTLATGIWLHGAGVWTSATSRQAFTNGVGDTLDTTSKTPATITGTRWGANQATLTANNGSTAYLAEMRIYNRALSAAEIWAQYDPVTRWDLYAPVRRWWSLQGAGFQAAWARNSNSVIKTVSQ